MFRYLRHIILLTPFLFAIMYGNGQAMPTDTVFFPVDEIHKTENQSEEIPGDSVILRESRQINKTRLKRKKRTSEFYENMDEVADKRRWIRELYNIIVIPPSHPTSSDSMITELSIGRHLEYEGLIIKNIRFVKLNPFNVSIRDTVLKEGNFWSRTANNLHIKTGDIIIQKQIFIKTGEEIDPQKLADNERLLRELPFIEDARIIVERVDGEPGAADVIIITKDLWSKAFFVEMKELNAGKVEIFDKNFFGSGLEIQNAIHWDPQKPDKWGYEANYKSPNILGSFINSRVYYINVFETESFGYRLEREFFTQDIKYAGGSSGYYLNNNQSIWVPDSGFREARIKTNYLDFWAGRSFQIKKESLFRPGSLNLILASRIIKENYSERPEVGKNSYYRYHNKVLWLNSLALSKQSYFKSNLIYSFGRTEDIPTGFLANISFGPEFSEFSNRFYTSLNLSKGNYVDNIGYLYTKMALGGFHTQKGKYEQAVLDVRISWFTNLFILGNFKLRQFLKINYLKGFDRFYDEKVYINDPNGIRGFSERNVFGDKKLVFSLETDVFLPFNLIGFQFVGFGFADFAFLGDHKTDLLTNDLFTGLGFGLRIRNERLAFPTFQLRFAFYPNLPELSPSDFMRFLGEERFRPDNFNVNAPSLLDFR